MISRAMPQWQRTETQISSQSCSSVTLSSFLLSSESDDTVFCSAELDPDLSSIFSPFIASFATAKGAIGAVEHGDWDPGGEGLIVDG